MAFYALVAELCADLSFELHRRAKTGQMSLEELWCSSSDEVTRMVTDADKAVFEPATRTNGTAATPTVMGRGGRSGGTDLYGQVPPREPRYTFNCAHCGQKVGVLRYAPHLDKCMGGKQSRATSRRGTSRAASSSSSPSSVSSPPSSRAASPAP